MGYDQCTVPDDCSCGSYFYCFPLALANTFPWPFLPILSNFFEKKKTQNHPQCLLGLSRTLFPTTFLEIAVYQKQGLQRPPKARSICMRKTTFAIQSRLHCIVCDPNKSPLTLLSENPVITTNDHLWESCVVIFFMKLPR